MTLRMPPLPVRRWLVFTALALPALWLGWQWGQLLGGGWSAALGANPVEASIHQLGIWGLRILLLTLAVTPAVRWLGWRWLGPHRRMIGLFAFAYIAAHLALYLWLDLNLSLAALWADVVKRWYITLGMAGFALLLPLAITSTRGWMKRLGRRWSLLHRLIYPAVLLGVLHYAFLVKARDPEPLVYGAILLVLLAVRLPVVARLRVRSA